MNSELQVFNNSEFGALDVLTIGDKQYFPATKCAEILGYGHPENAIKRHCRYSLKRGLPHPQSLGKTIQTTFIPEGDLYRLIVRSKLPAAERFEKWVFDEVLPSISKHGAYMTPDTIEKAVYNPDFLMNLAMQLKTEQATRRALEIQITEDKPKVLLAEAITTSKTLILVGELSKILKQNGIKIGQNRMFAWLRENNYLIKRHGTDYNMPTQRSMELELFEIKETVIYHTDGRTTICKTPKVTGKGQQYFVTKFLRERSIA